MEAALRCIAAGGTYVNLDFNEIGDAGATQLADALRVNATVHTLDLRSNSIGEAGATQLADALRVNATLHSLSPTLDSLALELGPHPKARWVGNGNEI